ncbi:CBASS oligonucleotide cyclase [Maricaulis sp.]|uniref:CBASS oligonucleotide cyclase n=1 Tax=Maricaulis sp. TaxID=1486257 RepID=UPI003437E31C
MGRQHVGHSEIATFAGAKVNLPQDVASKYRQQVRGLRDRLKAHLDAHPNFSLKKMLLSGSLAKGTALRSLNDIDVGVYVAGSSVPDDIGGLLDYIADKIVEAYPNVTSDQLTRNTYSITLSFKGSGLDVDIVPILYYGDPDWRGDLVSQDDGSFLETSIPLHLDFIRDRKKAAPNHYAQVIRLLKYWSKQRKDEDASFRFKSFMIELIMAKLADQGVDFSDYPEALQQFFTYIINSNLSERIVFNEHYDFADVECSDVLQIIDPVNAKNNVARLYTSANVNAIVDAAEAAGDAIDWALSAPTKTATVEAWQGVFGPTFQV